MIARKGERYLFREFAVRFSKLKFSAVHFNDTAASVQSDICTFFAIPKGGNGINVV